MLRLNPDEKGTLRNKGPSKASPLFQRIEYQTGTRYMLKLKRARLLIWSAA
jgi:hypothetical protein